MMRYKKARELLALIKWEIDCGEGAAGYDWEKAAAAAAALNRLISSALTGQGEAYTSK